MKYSAILSVLLSIIAVSMAAEPSAEVMSSYTAPHRGCIEARYYLGGSYYRTYACDGPKGKKSIIYPCLQL